MLMQRYYRAARAVTQINTILLLTYAQRFFLIRMRFRSSSTSVFRSAANCWKYATKTFSGKIRRDSGKLLLLQQNPDLKARSAATLRAMWRAAPLINGVFRRNPCNRALFMEILRQPRGLTRELRLMNRYGILGRYIPAFGRIVGQMQHDLFTFTLWMNIY